MIENLALYDLDQLAARAGHPGSIDSHRVEIEFIRRQTEAQIEAAGAQKRAADYAERNARYMLWSVVVLATASTLTFALQLAAYFKPLAH